MTGSAGKTFSGPQSGIIVWDDPALTEPVTTAVFPVWAATHQVNRVAALALATAEAIAFGEALQAQIVKNAQALAAALQARGIPMLGAPQGLHHDASGDRRCAQIRPRPESGADARTRQHHRQQEPAARPTTKRTGTFPAACASAPSR